MHEAGEARGSVACRSDRAPYWHGALNARSPCGQPTVNSSNCPSLKLFGSPSLVAADGVPVAGPAAQRHRLGLLALLALAPGHVSSRDRVMAYLWPESDAERARALLNQAVYQLRKVLGEDAIVSIGDELRLETGQVDVDVVRFEEMLEGGDTASGVPLYRGPLMDGFHLGGGPPFDEWLDRERSRLARTYAGALESLADAAQEAGDHKGAMTWWQARASHDPYDSRVALRLMQAMSAGGNPAGALRHATRHARLLREEFGIAAPIELTELQERLRAQGPSPDARPSADDEAVGVTDSGATEDPRPPDEEASVGGEDAPGRVAPSRTGPRFLRGGHLLTALGASLVGAASFWFLSSDGDGRWLEREALPAIERALDVADWETAYTLAKQIEARAPERRELNELWPRISWLVTLESEPSGARVFRRAYDDEDEEGWTALGRTPLVDIRVPYGLSQLRFELEGYRPLLRTLGGAHVNWTRLGSSNPDGGLVGPELFRLDTEESLPDGMVRVPGWQFMVGSDTLRARDFLLGAHEVTNAEYRAFVDAGGYARPELWAPIVVRGDTLAWETAREIFVDGTGRPGPSTWEAGDYPAGEDDHPVSGVSWYEADAYARFAGYELPTALHWRQALANATFPWLLPASNFSRVGPRSVREGHAMSSVAAYDLAGNVREWTASRLGDARVILGGSWNDPYYVAGTGDASAPPEHRAAANGFRLARTMDEPEVRARLGAPVPRMTAAPTLGAQLPVSEETYAAYTRHFDYDRLPLNDAVEAVDTTRLWIRERVSFDAAYGPERVLLYLYLPRNTDPPFQTVVYWPGWDVFALDDVDEYFSKQLDFVVRSGRAVAFPVYRGTFERRVGEQRRRAAFGSAEYRDNAVHGVKDLRRTLDYLETRADVDRDAFAYFGYSWGGVNGPVALAQEPRLRVAVIDIGLLPDMRATPEVDPVNALPRVRVPTLMLSGEFDPIVPQDNAERYFELIGTDAKAHRWAIGGHVIPRPLVIRETWEWLDRWLGAPDG